MSNIPRHSGPSRQGSNNIDASYNETSYGGYTNQGQHASGRAIINNINQQTKNYQYASFSPLEELRKHCSPSAAFNSAARFDPPRCAESTRLRIIQIIEEWINSDEDDSMPSSIFWLYGGAGAGKSALAQSLSEKFQNKGLAASFFFFKGDATRNNGNQLIPTLVSQLLSTFKGISPFVEDRIRETWDLFMRIYQIQIQELLIEPLISLKSTNAPVGPPRLIVIDGLDECDNPDFQCELLRAIARAIPHIPYPLRFLVTSRPEAHITHVFNHDLDLQTVSVHRYNLSDDPDADIDIRKFIEEEFVDIRRVHRLRQHLPYTWPDPKAITLLVERSSGHFIYASTVVRYIQSQKHRPDNRLEVVLRLRPPQRGDQPYAQLDALYRLIFAGIESRDQLEKICLVLGILYFRSIRVGFFERSVSDVCTIIEDMLEMETGDLVLLVDPILSLITIEGAEVRIFHKTLFDYLLDVSRGGHLPFDLARVHESIATYILRHQVVSGVCNLANFQRFAYHCQYACLNDTLKKCLHSLEVPYPKSVMTHASLDSSLMGFYLRQSIWYFLRTLSRKDIDSTGQVWKQHMAKWMTCLDSVVPIFTDSQREQRKPVQASGLKRWLMKVNSVLKKSTHEINIGINLKHELDALLTEWKPKDFNPVGVGIDQARHLAHVKQEHKLFSAFTKAFFRGYDNTIFSSLVFGDDFIHSYHFATWDDQSFMIINTYSKHDDLCFRKQLDWLRHHDTAAEETQEYLTIVEKCLVSGMYKKYGLRPDNETDE